MGQPFSEELVDEAWLAFGACEIKPINKPSVNSLDPLKPFYFVRIPQYSFIDKIGIDRFFGFKIRCGDGADGLVESREWLPIQVKTSDNGRALGIVLPLPKVLPGRLSKLITPYISDKIAEHARKHPAIECILFVPHIGGISKEDRKKALSEIWRETKKMINVKYKRLTGDNIFKI